MKSTSTPRALMDRILSGDGSTFETLASELRLPVTVVTKAVADVLAETGCSPVLLQFQPADIALVAIERAIADRMMTAELTRRRSAT